MIDTRIPLLEPDEPSIIDGAALLDDIVAFVRKYVFLGNDAAVLLALWVAFTYIFERFTFAPYLAITSAVRRCGKSRLLEVLGVLVQDPLFTSRISVAALVRALDADRRVLLLDELDATLRGDREAAEALRGALNAGFHRDGKYVVCVGKGADLKPRSFAVFGPKALAGIGQLQDTVADRAIPIRMERRAAREHVEKFRERYYKGAADELRARLSHWTASIAERAANAEPHLPNLDDRAEDIIEPLIAIADAASLDFGTRARNAAIALLAGRDDEAEDGTRVLRDIRSLFDEESKPIGSADLASRLSKIEDGPYGADHASGDFNARRLARLLKPFGIAPHPVRIGERLLRGYRQEQFAKAFDRYLTPRPNRNGVTTAEITGIVTHAQALRAGSTRRLGDRNNPSNEVLCCDVTLAEGDEGSIRI